MNALECLSFLDLAKYISGNGEQGQIPSPVPALDFVIGLMLAETKEQIKEMTDEAVEATLETAKDMGIKGIEEFIDLNANDLSFSTGNINDSGLKTYVAIDVSQPTLNKILTGKVRKIKQVEDLRELDRKMDEKDYQESQNKPFNSSLKYVVLYKNEYDDRIADYIQIINCILLK